MLTFKLGKETLRSITINFVLIDVSYKDALYNEPRYYIFENRYDNDIKILLDNDTGIYCYTEESMLETLANKSKYYWRILRK